MNFLQIYREFQTQIVLSVGLALSVSQGPFWPLLNMSLGFAWFHNYGITFDMITFTTLISFCVTEGFRYGSYRLFVTVLLQLGGAVFGATFLTFLFVAIIFFQQSYLPGSFRFINFDFGRIIAAQIYNTDADSFDSGNIWVFILGPLFGLIVAIAVNEIESLLELLGDFHACFSNQQKTKLSIVN